MGSINSKENNYVRFYLQSSIYGRVKMDVEPGLWNDDDLELTRAEEHGMFTQFTNALEFYGKYRDIIENTFQTLGNNGSLYLIKEELLDNGEDVLWTEIYTGRADWETKEIENGTLKINFNSNELEEIMEAHATDEFEIEVLKSIDDVNIGVLEKSKTDMEGRDLFSFGHSVLNTTLPDLFYVTSTRNSDNRITSRGVFIETEIIQQGFDRHATVDSLYYDPRYPNEGLTASNCFFVDSTAIENDLQIRIQIRTSVSGYHTVSDPSGTRLYCRLVKFKRTWSDILDGYYRATVEVVDIIDIPCEVNSQGAAILAGGEVDVEFTCAWDEGFYVQHTIKMSDGELESYGRGYVRVHDLDIKINVVTYHEPSIDLSCVFIHDVFDRLAKIITSKQDRFYSKWCGRTELGYHQDGYAGLVALMSGYWVRAFDPESPRYKSPVFSWNKLLESCNAVFNIGMGVENINGVKRFRAEEVDFFYQNQVVVDLGQVSNVKRKYDKTLYYSGIEIGYNKGGDYENAYGLDEPNILSRFVTPDRKSKNKYKKISDIRADETELELTRRKPEISFPDEDTKGDSHNWFLDLKRAYNGKFQQRHWSDRLESEPLGINAPDNFRSFLFSPLRMLFRHGMVLRAGLETYLNKKIKWISSTANSQLVMHYIDEDEAFKENLPDGLLVSKIDRANVLPETITFDKNVDRDLINKIYGKTSVFYKGSWEDIPNYYFKFRWVNEKQETESGYLMNFKPSNLGKFEMQKFNNKKIV